MSANIVADAAATGEREVTTADDRGTKQRAQRVSGTADLAWWRSADRLAVPNLVVRRALVVS